MRKCFLTIFIFLTICFSVSAKKVIAVLDFDTEIQDYESNCKMMSDMLRSELVQNGRFDVVDRKSISAVQKELALQMSETMSPENVKTLGKRLNADYLVIGYVNPLSDAFAYKSDKGFFESLSNKVSGKTEKVEVVVQIEDIETLKIISSSSVELDKWTDFSTHTRKMVTDLTKNISKEDSISDKILENMNSVTGDIFEGTWFCELNHDRIIDAYTIVFGNNHKVTIDVTTTDSKGKETSSSGSGRYVYNETERALTVTVNSMKGSSYIKNVSWKSMINPKDDGAFSCVIPVNYKGKKTSIRGDFYKE